MAKFTPTKFESVFDYETLQKTSAPPRTARELSHVKWLGIIKIYFYFLKKYFFIIKSEWSGISETPTFKKSGVACPQISLRWAAFSPTTFLSRVRTPTKSHATPLKKIYKVFYTSLPWFVRTVCCRRLPSQQSLWPAVTLTNLAWWSARPAHVTRFVKSSSAACGIEDDTL